MGERPWCERKRLGRFRDLVSKGGRLKGVKSTTKMNILLLFILVLVARLFFSTLFDNFALAEPVTADTRKAEHEILDPLSKIKDIEEEQKKPVEKACVESEIDKPSLEIKKADTDDQGKYMDFVANYPMAEMVPFIAKREKKTAAFLVSIAKKESDWGLHSPSKNGKHCYNYWGYKGGYNPTESGYSCFDSAEQAIQVVGDRIDELVGKKLDSPQKMVVWKCGGGYASDGNAGEWIGTVNKYFSQLAS
jgi:hypothetical protein